MPDARSRPERPPAERLPLGQASRLLGVDPDTLRRWADEGRVPAFTTLGGHRRFERRALERLVATRRTGAVGRPGRRRRLDRPPERRLPPPLRRDPRRRPRPPGHRPRGRPRRVPRHGPAARRRAGALPRRQPARRATTPRPRPIDLAALLGERVRRHGIPLEAGVSMFVAARRPFLAELRLVARRSGVNAVAVGQLYDTSTGLLDRLLLVFVEAHADAIVDDDDASWRRTHEPRRAAGADLDPGRACSR